MCVAPRKKAPRPRPVTWRCSMTSAAAVRSCLGETFLDDPDRQALGLANQCIVHMGRQERKLSKPNKNPQPSARTSTIGGVKTSKETRRYYVHMLSTNTRQASVV